MRTKRCFSASVVFLLILCVPVLGEVEAAPAESKPVLLGQPDPALAEIKLLCVVIASTSAEAGKDGLDTMALQTKVEDRLKEAGIEVFVPKKGVMYELSPSSNLEIYLEIVNVADLHQCVFRVQTLLSQYVHLKEQSLNIRADVWKTKPVMQKVSAENMPAAVTSAVLEQVEAFIYAYLAANHPNKRPSDANLSGVAPAKTDDVNVVPEEQVTPADESTPAEYKYVTSKNSKVFHKPDCSSAKRIKPENLVGYSSRDEAIAAGKRPCKRCNP
ncbi:MAG: Ada metal-binding domain-containing protein [Phycisphaerae bacterium]|jgi:hypothetical protein